MLETTYKDVDLFCAQLSFFGVRESRHVCSSCGPHSSRMTWTSTCLGYYFVASTDRGRRQLIRELTSQLAARSLSISQQLSNLISRIGHRTLAVLNCRCGILVLMIKLKVATQHLAFVPFCTFTTLLCTTVHVQPCLFNQGDLGFGR